MVLSNTREPWYSRNYMIGGQANIYDKLSTNITITFASHRKSVHKLQIRPIVSPSIAPKNGLLIR